MITEAEIKWLEDKIPSLKVNDDRTEVRGTLEFSAAYDSASNQFTWLFEPDQTAVGEVLNGIYKVIIKKGKRDDELPTLLLEDDSIPRTLDRHFYTSGRACLCGPTEEVDFMSRYTFYEYLDRYTIEFLYGQAYYDRHDTWPWETLAHNAAGIFQSYGSSARTQKHLHACIRRLKLNDKWKQIRPILSGATHGLESRKCFCGSGDQMRSCHVEALYGLIKLRADVRKFGTFLS